MSHRFPVRWTVTLGVHKTPEDYIQDLESSGYKIGGRTRDILKKVTCSKEQIEIRLTSATVAELGFAKGGAVKDIHAAILAQDCQLCPAEVGPALRLTIEEQSKYEWMWIAMKGISDSYGNLIVFLLEHIKDELWLGTDSGYPGNHMDPNCRIVFVVPA